MSWSYIYERAHKNTSVCTLEINEETMLLRNIAQLRVDTMNKSYLSDTELRYLTDELNARFYALSQTLAGHRPTTKTDGAGRASWVDPERVRLLDSTQTQRKIAVDDFATILRRIAAIK